MRSLLTLALLGVGSLAYMGCDSTDRDDRAHHETDVDRTIVDPNGHRESVHETTVRDANGDVIRHDEEHHDR